MSFRLRAYLYCVSLFLLVLPSCKKETEPSFSQKGPGYFPCYIGKSVTYLVDSTIWDDFNQSESTRRYLMRYDFKDTFFDNTGRKTHV